VGESEIVNLLLIFTITLVFKDGFPALTGILTLAYFIHNCILSIMRNQERPENNVSSPARQLIFKLRFMVSVLTIARLGILSIEVRECGHHVSK